MRKQKKKALTNVMPDTAQRYCLWHILSKLPVKFKEIVDYNRAALQFKILIYKSVMIQEFETKLGEFLVTHGLQNKE
ncbi:hypothetical protein ACS0TY_032077 [Phlomoides rotata]